MYGLVSDITLNKRAEQELKESAENLRKLNEAKGQISFNHFSRLTHTL